MPGFFHICYINLIKKHEIHPRCRSRRRRQHPQSQRRNCRSRDHLRRLQQEQRLPRRKVLHHLVSSMEPLPWMVCHWGSKAYLQLMIYMESIFINLFITFLRDFILFSVRKVLPLIPSSKSTNLSWLTISLTYCLFIWSEKVIYESSITSRLFKIAKDRFIDYIILNGFHNFPGITVPSLYKNGIISFASTRFFKQKFLIKI